MPRVTIKELDSTEKGLGSDMNLYFNHSFCLLSLDGLKKEWVKYLGAKGDGHWFSNLEGSFCIPHMHPKAFIEWVYPTGWFNYKTTAVYCERIPKRQYTKGLSHHNFSMSSAESVAQEAGLLSVTIPKPEDKVGMETLTLTKYLMMRKASLSLEDIVNTFENPKYESYGDSYDMMRGKKCFSRALSKDFSLVPSTVNKNFLIFCHDIPVGELVHKNKLKVTFPPLKPECLSFFSKQGVTVIS